MVRLSPNNLTAPEARALERLSTSVDTTGMSTQIKRRLELLCFAQEYNDGLLITVDGLLQLEIQKESCGA